MSIYILMFRQFLRTRTCQIGLLLVFVLGVISIVIGRQFLQEQKHAAAEVVEVQDEHIRRNVELHNDDIGLLLYYLKFGVVNDIDPLTALSIGQKDVNPSVQSVTLLALEGQKYDTDLVNPAKLLYGNLDFSFILVYVFPLLVIAFTYNLRSEEEEAGTWRMVSVMSKSNFSFLMAKLAVRFSLLTGVMAVLLVMALLILGIPLSGLFIQYVITGLLYLVFWFALSGFIVSFKRNSNFNALTLLSSWLVLVVLLPSALNNMVATKYPVPEAFTTMIKQRDGYHEKWDTDKDETMNKFYNQYPQFSSYGYPSEEGFSWLWYYAMQNLGDQESQETSNSMREKIMEREKASRKYAQFIPSIHAQLAFNDMAGSGLTDYMEFLDYIDKFHEQTRLYFYPKIFTNEKADQVDWQRFKPEHVSIKHEVSWSTLLLPLITSIAIVLCGTFVVYKLS